MNRYEQLRENFLNVCMEDCAGDSSVGIPSCPYYQAPDIDGSGKAIPGGCLLKMEQESDKIKIAVIQYFNGDFAEVTPEEFEAIIEGLHGLVLTIPPILLKMNHDGMGVEDAEEISRHLQIAAEAVARIQEQSGGVGLPRLNALALDIHKTAVEHGWYEKEPRFPEVIALFHSELSEALEEWRESYTCAEIRFTCDSDGEEPCEGNKCIHRHNKKDSGVCENAKPKGIAVELADCIIRILDTCAFMGIDIEQAIRIKNEYNKARPYRHGGKAI